MKWFKHPLIYIILCFLIPLILAILQYRGYVSGFDKKKNYGQLVTPPYLLDKDAFIHVKGDPFLFSSGKWHVYLVFQDAKHIDKLLLDQLKRIQLALGRDLHRVVVRVIFNSPKLTDDINKLNEAENIFIAKEFAALKNGLYVVDPKGWVILHYPEAWKNTEVYKDLRRLLDVSQIG